jgi:hypothetical protein
MLDHARPVSSAARTGNVYIQIELGELVEGRIEEGLVEVPSVSSGCEIHDRAPCVNDQSLLLPRITGRPSFCRLRWR